MTRKPSCLISCSQMAPEGGCGADVGRQGAMKPGGSVREYSGMGRWDRRRSRGGQQNWFSKATKFLHDGSSLYPRFHAGARIANRPTNRVVKRAPSATMEVLGGSFTVDRTWATSAYRREDRRCEW